MADWGPWVGDKKGPVIGYASTGAGVTPGATAHTKGGYGAGLDTDTGRGDGLRVIIDRVGDTVTSSIRTILVDIMTGGQVLIANLMLCPPVQALGETERMTMMDVQFPILVPPGNINQFKAQASVAAHPAFYMRTERAVSGMPCVGSVVDTYGADTTNTKGTTVTALSDATATTVYGSWVQLSASTERIKALVVAVGHGQQDLSAVSDCYYEIELGIGSAGNEAPIALVTGQTNSDSRVPTPGLVGPFYVDVAPGSRLVARIRKSPNNSALQRSLDVVAYGIR